MRAIILVSSLVLLGCAKVPAQTTCKSSTFAVIPAPDGTRRVAFGTTTCGGTSTTWAVLQRGPEGRQISTEGLEIFGAEGNVPLTGTWTSPEAFTLDVTGPPRYVRQSDWPGFTLTIACLSGGEGL